MKGQFGNQVELFESFNTEELSESELAFFSLMVASLYD